MILVDHEIIDAKEKGEITISPFVHDNVGTNSYDVTLANEIRVYDPEVTSNYASITTPDGKIDTFLLNALTEQPTRKLPRTELNGVSGYMLYPEILYLGATIEEVGSDTYVTLLHGRSSMGRIGLGVHVTAGFGDIGFTGSWTLEMTVIHPTFVIPHMKIGQISFHKTSSKPLNPYNTKSGAKYNLQKSGVPKAYIPDDDIRDTNFKIQGRDE